MEPMQLMMPVLAVAALEGIRTLNANSNAMREASVAVRGGYLEQLSTSIQRDDGKANSLPQNHSPDRGRGR